MASPTIAKSVPRLFISYSHDSREHEDQVRALADRLREDGIDAVIDQYDTAPPEGWPMWMEFQIRKADFVALVCTETYLQRVERREQPGKGRGVLWEAKLIYNLLYGEDTAFQRFIPILTGGARITSIPLPIRGLTWYQADVPEGYEAFLRHLKNQHQLEKPPIGKCKAQPAIKPHSYPSSLGFRLTRKPDSNPDRRVRSQIIQRVWADWIDGVLNQSLYEVARIELGLSTKSDAVEQPLRAIVQTPDRPPEPIPPGTAISQIFDNQAGALLILGAPGTGKTTLLLELAKELLNRAEQDENHPIPVVFNLSSWAARCPPFDEWLVSELNERSDVPRRLAQQWIKGEQVLPLLDGLDEVSPKHRQACVEAINDFRRDHGLLPIAVCSRVADYEALGAKLRLRNAILIQPLTRIDVERYLESVREQLRELRQAAQEDPSLWDLLETPLMLWVAMLAYRNAPVTFSLVDSLEERRHQLFTTFIDAMLRRRSAEMRYSPKQTVAWLHWLASALTEKKQSIFYLEDLDDSWLPKRSQRLLSRAGIVVGSGVVIGLIYAVGQVLIAELSGLNIARYSSNSVFFGKLIFGVTPGLLLSGLFFGLLCGMTVGLVGIWVEHRPSETMRISLRNISSRLPKAARVGILVAPIFGLINGLKAESFGLKPALLYGMIFMLLYGLGFGLVTLLFGEAMETRRSPNQGTHRSIKIALMTCLIAGLIVWLIDGPLGGPNIWVGFRIKQGMRFWLASGAFNGLEVGPIFGLVSGGLFSLRHLFVRLALWRNQLAPFFCVPFLDYAAERIFLRKISGGYIFIHRMLLEHFASLPLQPMPKQPLIT